MTADGQDQRPASKCCVLDDSTHHDTGQRLYEMPVITCPCVNTETVYLLHEGERVYLQYPGKGDSDA